MAKISKDALAIIQAQLESVDDSWQSSFSLREVVKMYFPLIQKARNHKASWEEIAKIIESASGADSVKPGSVSKYYAEIAKNPETATTKKRSSGRKKTDTTKETSGTIDSSVLETDADIQVVTKTAKAKSNQESSEPSAKLKAEEKPKQEYGAAYKSDKAKVSDEFNM